MDLTSYTPKVDHEERRRQPRTALTEEILVIESESGRVRDVLVAADLSPQGIRVEPHPSVSMGDVVQIAFSHPEIPNPVAVIAKAVRNDGDLGWLLFFVDVDHASDASIQRLLRVLPAAHSYGSPPPEDPAGVMLARVQTKCVLG